MATGITLWIFFHIFVVTTAVEIFGTKIGSYGPKSNTVTVKYEGTEEDVKLLGSSLGLDFKTKIFGDWYLFTIPQSTFLVPKEVPDIHITLNKAKKLDKKVKFIQQERWQKRSKRALTINDEEWPNQWNLQPSQTPNMNVYKAWEVGYTGKGITVAVVDDGIDVEHPDLMKNYNSTLSYDFVTDVPDASHKEETDGHGTNCAGLVAAVKDTNCIIGVAYESTLTGIRNLGTYEDDDVQAIASIEAMALTHKYKYIDIYSNSWGPEDDGLTMDALEPILNDAFELTLKEGRDGKGAIYTFASGNGGRDDSCGADPYASSMYTISIAAVDQLGAPTTYSETCTSIMAATYSGDESLLDITTTGPNQTCIDDFDGTSAATPQASGIIALTLQANPDLTWRDIQHMIVELSNQSALRLPGGNFAYYTNGAGKQVSLFTGFGLMDAKAMVDNAPTWITAPPRISCGSGHLFVDRYEYDPIDITAVFDVTNCFITYLEHVQIYIHYNSSYRGDVEIYLLSPMGTESNILSARQYDDVTNLTYFTFMSLHTWGEDPNGEWKLTLFPTYMEMDIHLFEWGLELYGTATDPQDGIPSAGTFGSPCNDTDSCDATVDGGCLKDTKALCDNICAPCKNGYHFSGGFCEKDCPPLVSADSSYVVLTYTQEGVIAKYSCYEGYAFIEGDLTRRCGDDGVWTGTEAICEVDCGQPDAPVNGNVSFSGTTYGFDVVYSCIDGYLLTDGDEERHCLEDGQWNGTEPTCERDMATKTGRAPVASTVTDSRKTDCGPLESPEHGNVSSNGTIESSEAVYTCNEGYVIDGGDARRVCGADGEWSSNDPVCLIVCCPLEPPTYGTVNFTSTTEGSNATYTCFTEFDVSSGSTVRTCAPDGFWTGVAPVCDIDCGPLDSPANGTVSVSSTTKGSTAAYSCFTGFAVKSGSELRACSSDGLWTGVKPNCVSRDVLSKASKANWNVVVELIGIIYVVFVIR